MGKTKHSKSSHKEFKKRRKHSERRSTTDSSEKMSRKKDKKDPHNKSSDRHGRNKRKRSSSSSSDVSSSTSSSSSSSSSSSGNSIKLLQRLESNRIKEALERKRVKEEMKLNETPEEKRARRLREKQLKEYKRRERMGWDNEYQHYTNQDNPFGDAHLTSTFVWNKKLEKKGLKGMPNDELEIINRQKQMENKMELEKVKKRRQERELERLQREEEMVLLQRTREAAQFEEWERQEDKFHLEQARLRSKIRIQDGRAKPIDLLAQYISNQQSHIEETIEMQMHEPYTYLNGLGIQDLEDLLIDINVYIELEKGCNNEYWDDLTVIVQDELQKLKKLELGGEYHVTVGRREGIHQSVAKDVTEIFRGKSAVQLNELKSKIQLKIETKSDGVDIGYWESLLSQLKAHMARARLKDKHQENLRLKLEILKQEQHQNIYDGSSGKDIKRDLSTGISNTRKYSSKYDNEVPSTSGASSQIRNEVKIEKSNNDEDVDDEMLENQNKTKQSDDEDEGDDDDDNDNDDDAVIGNEDEQAEENVKDLLSTCFDLYELGKYSPIYLTDGDNELQDVVILTEEQYQNSIEFQRNRILQQQSNDEDLYSREEARMAREARKGMADDEAEFSVETKIDTQIYLWSDKYRPRKPRYFNRVHTGFEWNKYNQTHYDLDNPPPKIVQGYKFNIFYPDLIEKHCTPQYYLTPCNDNKDFAILRFHAGPPYEDLAFKIVNREWEFSYKRGFRCQFHNNIFQLWFHFKRYRYRR